MIQQTLGTESWKKALTWIPVIGLFLAFMWWLFSPTEGNQK